MGHIPAPPVAAKACGAALPQNHARRNRGAVPQTAQPFFRTGPARPRRRAGLSAVDGGHAVSCLLADGLPIRRGAAAGVSAVLLAAPASGRCGASSGQMRARKAACLSGIAAGHGGGIGNAPMGSDRLTRPHRAAFRCPRCSHTVTIRSKAGPCAKAFQAFRTVASSGIPARGQPPRGQGKWD